MIPEKYRKSSEIIANYDFTDIMDGIGYINYYGCTEKTSAATNPFLTRQGVYSNPIYTAVSAAQDAAAILSLTEDYDITINYQRTMNGNIIMNIPAAVVSNNSNPKYIYLTIQTIKISGGVSTSIGTVTTDHLDIAAATTLWKMFCIKQSATNVVLKVGDTLRFEIKVYSYLPLVGGTLNFLIYHDPASRVGNITDTTNCVSQMTFTIPFKLNL